MDESTDLIVDVGGQLDKESENDSIEAVDSIDENNPKQSTEPLNKPVKHLKLPFSKIKQIMKMDPDINLVQQDAVFLVSKATELFIEYLAKETFKQLSGNKRKTLSKKDVDQAIESAPQLCFLDGALE